MSRHRIMFEIFEKILQNSFEVVQVFVEKFQQIHASVNK
jgi:hypothetical protein